VCNRELLNVRNDRPRARDARSRGSLNDSVYSGSLNDSVYSGNPNANNGSG
jgi:hypothetical protein